MNSKRTLLLAGAAICAAALAVALIASHWRTQSAELLANLAEERGPLDAQLRMATERLSNAEVNRARLQAAVDRLRRAKPSPPAPAKTASGTGAPAKTSPAPRASGPTPAWRDQVMNDPALQVSWRNSLAPMLSREYMPLYDELKLSPDQIARFEAAFFRRDEQLVDLAAVARTQGADTRSAIATLQKRAHEEFDATLREVLGPDGWSQFREYQRLIEPRNVVRELAGLATHTGTPFGRREADEFVRALAQASSGYARGGPAMLRTVDWNLADGYARQILTPEQFALYRSSTARLNAQIDHAIARAQQADATVPNRAAGI